MTDIRQWEFRAAGEPMVSGRRPLAAPGPGEAVVRVAGCGVCHTDLGFWLGETRTHRPPPIVLGHEISGVVEAAGEGVREWAGRPVVVPAILPCGDCSACRRGRPAICAAQVFPGSDVHGGFASHVVVPARFLCAVDGGPTPTGLARLAVVADAVSTPFEAVRRSGLVAGEVAVVVGAGGVGGFGVQIAAALGGHVIAIDPVEERRVLALAHGASVAIDAKGVDAAGVRRAVRDAVRERGWPETEWKVFECSGTPAGQELAFALLTRGSHLGVVGYTPARVTVPLSHLMAFDARAEGNWGCAPGHYPAILRMIEADRIRLEPFVEMRPLSEINAVFVEAREHRLRKRPVLVPDFA
jgi:6-hydroxycyclohex-1-ene-1-carbonyl-CoA dehydrogenase